MEPADAAESSEPKAKRSRSEEHRRATHDDIQKRFQKQADQIQASLDSRDARLRSEFGNRLNDQANAFHLDKNLDEKTRNEEASKTLGLIQGNRQWSELLMTRMCRAIAKLAEALPPDANRHAELANIFQGGLDAYPHPYTPAASSTSAPSEETNN